MVSTLLHIIPEAERFAELFCTWQNGVYFQGFGGCNVHDVTTKFSGQRIGFLVSAFKNATITYGAEHNVGGESLTLGSVCSRILLLFCCYCVQHFNTVLSPTFRCSTCKWEQQQFTTGYRSNGGQGMNGPPKLLNGIPSYPIFTPRHSDQSIPPYPSQAVTLLNTYNFGPPTRPTRRRAGGLACA